MAARLPRLIAPVALALAAGTAAPSAGLGQTVTADHIRDAGGFRLGEVLRLTDGWDVTTVDEYTWRAAAPGTVPFQDDAWTVLVDGLPVEPSVLGVTALERLPLDLDAVDSVALVRTPRLASGILADRGTLHIHTSRPARGLSLRGRFATGQETGDPGPFEFVPPGRENRDRHGHDATLGAAYGGRGGTWWVAGGLGLGLHITADPAIRQRVLASGSDLRIERIAPSLRVGVDGRRGRHSLLLGRSELDDAFRLEAFGRELPAESVLDYAGVHGRVPVKGIELGYRLTADQAEIRLDPAAAVPPLDVERTSLRAEVEASLGGAGGRDHVGLGVLRREVRTAYAVENDAALVVRTFGSVGWRLGPAIRQRGSVAVEAGAGSLGVEVALEQEWRASPRDAVSLALGLGRPLREVDDGLLALTARGFGWLEDAGVPVAFEGPDDGPRAAAVHAGWERALGRGRSVRLSGFYRAFTADYIARRELSFDSVRLAWRGPVTLVSGARGQAGGVEISASAALSRGLTIAGSHRHQWTISTRGAVRDARDRVPRHSSQARVLYSPVPGFTLWAGLTARGGTRWPEYPGSEGTVPGAVALDLSVRKDLWDGRLQAGLGLRNLLDARLRFHPEGGAAWRAVTITLRTALPEGERD